MKALYSKISELMKNKRTRKILTRIISIVSAMVVFITTYALVLPAITLEKTASCGIEEHQHSDACYEYELACGHEESEGHHHDDSCYTVTKELDCDLEGHHHSQENGCYDEEGNLICELQEHVHDDSCYKEVKTLTCEMEESEGHHHTDACYEKVLVCDKEVHTHSKECYKDGGIEVEPKEEAADQASSVAVPEDSAGDVAPETVETTVEETLPVNYVPELEPLSMEAVFGKKTGFYYFHAEEGQEVPSNSAEITDWQKVEEDTELAPTDLVKMYLPYTIPAGSLNETNPTARYRLPDNIHLTDSQIKAINKNENGITSAYSHSDADYKKYLGAEAIEGNRTPDEVLENGAQEYISAIVRAENVYKNDKYIGQDLIFTFVPYTIEKNQKTFDAEKNPVSAGEKITGWFACDFRLDQIDWTGEEEQEEIQEEASEETDPNPVDAEGISVEKTAEILFVSEDKDEGISEIKRTLKLVEQKETPVPEEEDIPEFQSGTLTADGDGYKITLDYTEEAQISQNASLSVREITAETDKETYEACLAQAQQHVDESVEARTSVDSRVSRFFDIEIQVIDEDGTTHKIEPAAPVSVNIQIAETSADTWDFESGSKDAQNSDPTVLHFAEEGVEEVESTTTSISNEGEFENTDTAVKNSGGAEVSFEAESFSIYGLVYTVDFHWEVDGKEYEFSLPGGGFVSLKTLMEVLGVAEKDEQKENGGSSAENQTAENGQSKDTEATGKEEEAALYLENVQVSEETQKFVTDVEKVEFSKPELVWVGRTDSDLTVGELKEANSLEVQYSAALTEGKISEINAQTVEAGDWALIGVQPFMSEETLTVTMKDGEEFSIRVTDGQLHTYVISDSGETYEVIVTYDDTAEIPEDAELRVREIKNTEEEYTRNIEAANKELQSQEKPEVVKPVQFDIAIIAGGVEIEPKEGSTVDVEIRLAPEVFEGESSGEESEICFNGEKLEQSEAEGTVHYTGAHITDDGTAEIIEEIRSTVNEDEKIVLQFDTESFSTYIFDGQATGENQGGLYDIPGQIYVGDVIYMWNRGESVNTNGGVVQVTSIGNQNTDWSNEKRNREVKAASVGQFQIGNRWIEVLPKRQGTTPPPTIETIDNASIGLTLNLFDYDLNDYLDSYFNGSSHGENPLSTFAGSGINNGKDLKFWGSGIGNNYGERNQYFEHGVTRIVETNLDGGTGGYPKLRNSTQNLEYLFTPSNGTDKRAYTNVNGLFKKDGDYYVYDSNQNYAWYNSATNRFEVYNKTYRQKKGREQGQYQDKAIGFFPFHRYDEDYDLYVNWNKNLNHHFGMSMSVPFSMPKDPKAVTDTEGNPIIFEFSGDDDLWVFIDGKLAMDIGGIHQPTSGTINFQTGTVTVNGQSQLSASDFRSRFPNLYDGKTHTLQVFYIERGGADSNCKIQFNMTLYGDIHFDKVDKDDPTESLAGAVFGIYKDEDCTIPLMENLKNGTSRAYIAESDAQGHVQFSDIPIDTYYLKELHAPEGYPLDNTVHTVQVYLDQNTGQVKVKVTIDGIDVESGVQILNGKPAPITLGLRKEWQNADGESIAAPEGVTSTFEIKRIRTYETYTETPIEGEGRDISHLVIGVIHDGQSHIYEEFDLISNTQATVSWSYKDGYEGSKDCIVNGTRIDKDYVSGLVVSQGITMPAKGQTATIYIVDESENGDAVSGINVAGSQFYGNEGGGVIHTFETKTEEDPDFSYSGENVTNNQITLPINPNIWHYNFTDLPTFGRDNVEGVDHEVASNYTYYLEEVSSTSPEGTTVVYKDINGNIIDSATAGQTSTSGTETITNRVPFGYLKIEKVVTYNGSSGNLTSEQKSKLAGEYKFKIYKKEQCGAGDAVQDPDAPEDAEDKDLIITITIGEDGQAVSSDAIKLVAGNYWIKEVESSNPAMFPVENPIPVEVTQNNISTSPVIKSLTNNYDENNGPDKISVDIEKVFTGLDLSSQVPPNFQVKLHYTVNGQPREVTLHNTELATGENGEKVVWSHSTDGFIWHWKVSNIPSEATNFEIKEENYDKAKGYDWISATLNDDDITDTVTEWHDLSVAAPAASLTDVTNDRRTSDSGSNTVFYLDDSDILLSKLTANQGTLVISKHPLNLAERDAVVKGWPSQGGFKTPPHFFSIDEHPNGFAYGDKTVTFGEKNGRTTVKFTQNASAQEAVFAVSYDSEEARNNANLENTYEEVPITIDIIKVDEENNSKKLPGAIFTIRQIADEAPTDNGTLKTLDGTTPTDSEPTDENGKTSFSNLTHGYYEISEKQTPEGYVLAEESTFYFKIESGEVKWLVKGTNKPSEWAEKEEKAEGESVDFEPAHAAAETQSATNATFTVENTPGAALPSTGGPGTRLFTILGSILIAGAGILLWRRRRTI